MNFSFRLKGKDWFGLYLVAFLFYMVPLIIMQVVAKNLDKNSGNMIGAVCILALFAIMLFSILILITPILRKIVGGIYCGDTPLCYSGKTGEFVLFNIGNLLLCIVTLGIYFPWYLTKLWRYLAGKTTYKGNAFSFNGKGLHLLGICVATLAVPLGLYVAVIYSFAKDMQDTLVFSVINQIVVTLLMIPYLYFSWKWMVNISYREYRIRLNAPALQSMGVILREMFLTIVTVGIYYPVALVKIYEYFVGLVSMEREEKKCYSLSAVYDYPKVWKIVWGQILLTIVTVGVYGAWAYCRVLKTIIDETTLVKTEG